MNEFRSLYQAYQEYIRAVAEDPTHQALLRSLGEDPQAREQLEDQCTAIVWDGEWIEAFEAAFPFIEKAIEEQRRFIETYSEIRRVDQARKTTVDSIRHLAEHSNLISRVEGEDVIPDKILIVQREDNYAIYENRFLYTLVQQMQDFLNRRYAAVQEVNGLRELRFSFDRDGRGKNMRFQSRLTFALDQLPPKTALPEERTEDMSDMERVELLVRRTGVLVNAPLMRQLKGCIQVSSPIVRTNVFKKNENFKQALNLFEFLQRYQKPGYEIIREEAPAHLFPEELRAQLSELALLQALFSRLILDQDLAEGLRQEMALGEEQAALERQKQENVIEQAARSRVAQARREETVLRQREIAQREELIAQRDEEIARQQGEIADRDLRIEKADQEIQSLGQELTETRESYEAELKETREGYETQLKDTQEGYEQQLIETKNSYETQLTETREGYETQLTDTRNSYETQIAENTAAAERQLAETLAAGEQAMADAQAAMQMQMDAAAAEYVRRMEATQAEAQRMEQTLQDAREETRQALSKVEEERRLRRDDLEHAKEEMLALRKKMGGETAQAREETKAARKEIVEAQAKNKALQKSLLEAQRQLRETKEKNASLQKQLIQARESARKARGEAPPTRNVRHAVRKLWNGTKD
ncbi:MAG: hypothetical protein IJ188_01055 [Clostridia bacterium]|nr:hypothetical protein [Clostridia bacterium]